VQQYPLAAKERADRVAGRGIDNEDAPRDNGWGEPRDKADEVAWQAVIKVEPRSREGKRESLLLTEVPLLWDLLEIPCSADVGQTMAARAVELIEPTVVNIAGSTIGTSTTIATLTAANTDLRPPAATLPLLVRTRIANARDVEVESLTPADFARISVLNLSHSEFDDEGLNALAARDSPITALKALNLFGTKVSDQGVQALAAKDSPLATITKLNLYKTRITDLGVRALAAMDSPLTALSALSLGGTQVTDQGVLVLAAKDSALDALTFLDLGGSLVTDKGVEALAAKDSALSALTELGLSYTQVTDTGVIALAAEDSPLTALTTLWMIGTQVTDGGIAALKQRFPNLTIYQ
jgi:hypothetical protein